MDQVDLNMNNIFNDVETFMVAAGHFDSNKEKWIELYEKLIKEEYEEFLKAPNDAEKLDACFDMMWVIIGYMKSRGWNCSAAWEEGAKSNLAKIDPLTGLVLKREDGKVMKPTDWQPPNFEKFV